MRTKKILAMLAALSMIGCLASCGGESSTAEEKNSEAETTTTAATEATTEAPTTTTTAAPLPEADANAITFDAPSLYTAHPCGGGGDEADIQVDIVSLDGENCLRIHALRPNDDEDYGVIKLVFDIETLVGKENMGKLGHVSMNATCIARSEWLNEDDTTSLVVGNFIGAFGGNIAADKAYDAEGTLIQNGWSNFDDYSLNDWENSTQSWFIESDIPGGTGLPINGYASADTEYFDKDGNAFDAASGYTFFFFRWGQANDVDVYLDNITFYDKDGNSLPIQYDASGDSLTVVEDSISSAGTPADNYGGSGADFSAEEETTEEETAEDAPAEAEAAAE